MRSIRAAVLIWVAVGCSKPADPVPVRIEAQLVGVWEGKTVYPESDEPQIVCYRFDADGNYLHWFGKADDDQSQKLAERMDGRNNYRIADKKLLLAKNRNADEVPMTFTLNGDKLVLVFPPEFAAAGKATLPRIELRRVPLK